MTQQMFEKLEHTLHSNAQEYMQKLLEVEIKAIRANKTTLHILALQINEPVFAFACAPVSEMEGLKGVIRSIKLYESALPDEIIEVEYEFVPFRNSLNKPFLREMFGGIHTFRINLSDLKE